MWQSNKGKYYNCKEAEDYKANYPFRKVKKNGKEEVNLINFTEKIEKRLVFVNSIQIVWTDESSKLFVQESEKVFSIQEMWDFNKIRSDLEVTEVSGYTLFLFHYGTNKVVN